MAREGRENQESGKIGNQGVGKENGSESRTRGKLHLRNQRAMADGVRLFAVKSGNVAAREGGGGRAEVGGDV